MILIIYLISNYIINFKYVEKNIKIEKMAKDDVTPLMKQYNQIKAKYKDTILLYRVGDFFETFCEDAVITADVCGITLTKRTNLPLAGFPHHQLDVYLTKLVKSGLRVAVCDQIEDPKKAKGIVKRDVIEVVTPGVSLYDKLLDSKKNNYIISIYLQENKKYYKKYYGLAICDVSTGEFLIGDILPDKVSEVIDSYIPSEIIYSKQQKEYINDIIENKPYKISETTLQEWMFEKTFALDILKRQLRINKLKGFGISEDSIGINAAGALLRYISDTQKSNIEHINAVKLLTTNEYMLLDYATRRNLEILCTMEGESHGSLIKILDKTMTPPGSRLLKKWLNQPLNTLEKIHIRLDIVEALINNRENLEELHKILINFGDLERLIARISSGKATTRDIVTLAYSLEKIPQIKEVLTSINNKQLNDLISDLYPLKELTVKIREALVDDPVIQFGSGNIFRYGYNEELDGYVQAKTNAKKWLNKFQEDERYNLGINSLKVGYNSINGYYIEITKTHNNKIPNYYERKQTLVNSERYITPELKSFEEKIYNAENRIYEIEQHLFDQLKKYILQYIEQIQEIAIILANVDCFQSLATISIEYNYVKPIIDDSNVLEIVAGRHPVVERLLPPNETFCPNNTKLDSEKEQIHIITGPNMAGKSCYLRQNALIVLLGQIGCFVPAKYAHFGVVDRIFTRVGAQDNITTGESTFLVEMQEVSNILHNATNRSLILLDEVGRGTATFDGVSIAWAISEYLHNIVGAKTLFATHYHELNELANKYERIKNYSVDVIETNNKILFTHKVIDKASNHSFGIYVAHIAGLPENVIIRANEIMQELEKTSDDVVDTDNNYSKKKKTSSINNAKKIKAINKEISSNQMSIFEIRDDELRDKIRKIDINNITPIQAMQFLEELKENL